MSGTKGLLDRGGVKAVWPEAPGFWRGSAVFPEGNYANSPPGKKSEQTGGLRTTAIVFLSYRPGGQESKVKVSPATLPLKALGENLSRLPAPGGGSVGAQKMNFLPPSKLR